MNTFNIFFLLMTNSTSSRACTELFNQNKWTIELNSGSQKKKERKNREKKKKNSPLFGEGKHIHIILGIGKYNYTFSWGSKFRHNRDLYRALLQMRPFPGKRNDIYKMTFPKTNY